MLRYLLDTSIVSVPVWKEPDRRVVDWLNAAGPECAVAAPVWHELIYGCSRLPKGKRRSALEAYLRDVIRGSFPILSYDEASAAWHGAERARLESLGRTPPFVDGQIAAIAHVHGLILVTTNPRDFDAFMGLRIEDCSTRDRRGPKK
jgi:tRNA(fMet)-specific endonuclease VapC